MNASLAAKSPAGSASISRTVAWTQSVQVEVPTRSQTRWDLAGGEAVTILAPPRLMFSTRAA